MSLARVAALNWMNIGSQ